MTDYPAKQPAQPPENDDQGADCTLQHPGLPHFRKITEEAIRQFDEMVQRAKLLDQRAKVYSDLATDAWHSVRLSFALMTGNDSPTSEFMGERLREYLKLPE